MPPSRPPQGILLPPTLLTFLTLFLLALNLLITPTTAVSTPTQTPDSQTHPRPPLHAHFGHVFAANLTAPTGGCPGYTDRFPTPESATRWVVLSAAYGRSYCGKTVLMSSDYSSARTGTFTVVDICDECWAEDVKISEDWFGFLYEGDWKVVRRGRKFGARWWIEGGEDEGEEL